MASDSGSREADAPKPDFSLPEIVELRSRRVRYEPPRHRNFESSLKGQEDAVEFVITTDKPIPIRALGPVLYVGGVPVGESSPLRKKNAYRFVALEPARLEPGAPISLGWTGVPPDMRRRQTRFAYRTTA